MQDNDHSYFLKRLVFHRRRLVLTGCPEARLCHAQFVEAYQRRLAEIRGKRETSPEQRSMDAGARATLSLLASGHAKLPADETC